jgi:hypothetical protein
MAVLALALTTALLAANAPAADDEELVSLGPGDLSKYWARVPSSLMEGVGPKDLGREDAGCAAVAFIVEKDGSTSGFRLLRDMPPERFATIARKVVSNLKFEPTERNPHRQAVFTYVTISFRGADVQNFDTRRSSLITLDDRINDLCAVKGMQ